MNAPGPESATSCSGEGVSCVKFGQSISLEYHHTGIRAGENASTSSSRGFHPWDNFTDR